MPKPKRNIDATIQETLTPPSTLPPTQTIARLKQAAGKNLYQIELPSGQVLLVELEAKFRSTIWLKRGNYVVVDTGSLADRENKLGGEIVNVVGDEKNWRKASFWPSEFGMKKVVYGDDDGDDDEEDEGPRMPPSGDEDES